MSFPETVDAIEYGGSWRLTDIVIFETVLRSGKSRTNEVLLFDVHGVILGTQQNGGIDHYKCHRLLSGKASTVKNGIACLRKGKLQVFARGISSFTHTWMNLGCQKRLQFSNQNLNLITANDSH